MLGLNALAQTLSSGGCDKSQIITIAERTFRQGGEVIVKEMVTLPDRLPIAARRANVDISYKLDVSRCAAFDNAAIYTYRTGAPYRLYADSVQLDSWLPHQGFRDDWVRRTFSSYSYNGRAPTVFLLPKGTDKVQIALTSTPFLTVGLTTITLGAQQTLARQHAVEYERTAYASDLIAWLSLFIGISALALFFKRPTTSGLQWFGAGCLLWNLRNLALLNNVLPNEGFGGELLISYAIILSAFSLVVAVLYFNQMWREGFTSLTLKGFGLITVLHLICFAYPDLAIPLRTIGSFFVAATYIWIAIRLFQLKQINLKESRFSAYFMAVCLLIVVGCGVHDILIGLGILPPTTFILAYWGFSALMLTMAIVSSLKGVNALNRAQNTNTELEERVAQKNAELKNFYDAEQAEQLRSERARLNREIHDGIGAQLMTALRGVERGALSQDQITESLQDGLDELRLLMDSADIGHDLHGALFAWRNRWEPRLNAVDLSLNWDIAEEVSAVQLSQPTILQLIRILQESVANVVKHAKATQIIVEMHFNERQLVLTVTDNGIGISDVAFGASHRGLKHMEQRATLIGGSYSIQKLNTPKHGTQVQVSLPLA
ncbi:MAG: hypothetical protein RLY82_224 [Pseudomonadota bacterium]